MKWYLCFLCLLAGAIPAYAQVSLEVTVLDRQSSRPVVSVPVLINNHSIGFHASGITNKQGKARFSGLSTSGAYTVSVPASPHYKGMTATNITLQSNQTGSVIILLTSNTPVNLPEITVSAPVSKINTINAEVASKMPYQEINTLPVEGHDITKVLYRLPNITQATGFYPEAPNVSINGANSLYTNYLIDGMDNNENFLGGEKFPIPSNFTQNITALTDNYSAEYGISGNGVINITTRSGSNNFTGGAYYSVRPGTFLDASSPFAQRDLTGNPVRSGYVRHQFGIFAGGPIVKNKMFYFIDAEQTYDLKKNLLNVPQLGVSETIPGRNRYTLLSGKINRVWNPRFQSSLRINAGLVTIQRQGGGLEGGVTFPSAGNFEDRNSLEIASENTYHQPGFTSQTNFQYSRFRWNYARAENPNQPQVTVLGPSEQTLAILGNPGYKFNALENTEQFQQKFTLYRGNHTLTFGAGLISSLHSLIGGGNPYGNYVVKLTSAQLQTLKNRHPGAGLGINDIPSNAQVLNYNVELRPSAFGKRQNIWSVYFEDLWSLSSRLNVTLGLRYDYDNLSKGGASHGDFNNLAPRLSFNYKLTGRSSLRGGYSLVYDKIIYSVYSDALQQNTISPDYTREIQALKSKGLLPSNTNIGKITFNGNLTASIPGVTYLNGPTSAQVQANRALVFSNERRILNPNGYQNPYTHQFELGYQLQTGKDRLFYVDLMYTNSGDLFRLREVNSPAPYPLNNPNNVVVRTQAQADATRPVPIYTDASGSYTVINGDTLRGVSRDVTMTEDKGRAIYLGATFTYRKDRGSDNYSYRISYTLSKSRNNTEDINFRAEDANNFKAEWGPSINDRTHVINGIFTYYPTNRLSVTMAGNIQSGQPINRIPDATKYGTTDLNGDGRSFGASYVGNSDRSPGESRNDDRLPWADTFDASIHYRIPFQNGSHIELDADIFNIFNAANLSGYANNATQSNQIQVGPKSSGVIVRKNASPPRQFQFSFKYLF